MYKIFIKIKSLFPSTLSHLLNCIKLLCYKTYAYERQNVSVITINTDNLVVLILIFSAFSLCVSMFHIKTWCYKILFYIEVKCYEIEEKN